MVVDENISQALNRIADCLEDNNETLKQILGHYNSVVPPMKENTDRANKFGRMAEIHHQVREEAEAEETRSEEMRSNGLHN